MKKQLISLLLIILVSVPVLSQDKTSDKEKMNIPAASSDVSKRNLNTPTGGVLNSRPPLAGIKPQAQEQLLGKGMINPDEQTIKKEDVPKNILTAFEKKYHDVKVTGYAKTTYMEKPAYSIRCIDDKIERQALYNAAAVLVLVRESIQFADVPAPVRDALAKEYPKGTAMKNERTIKGDRVTYEIAYLTKDMETIHLAYDPTGKRLDKAKVYQ